jgi:phosphodiesterase/alkaline phosphatase D-like protein
MQDPFKELMFRSFKDAMDVAADYNAWAAEAFDEPMPVQPNAIPQLAMLLYRSRMQARLADGSIDFPDLDDRMYD